MYGNFQILKRGASEPQDQNASADDRALVVGPDQSYIPPKSHPTIRNRNKRIAQRRKAQEAASKAVEKSNDNLQLTIYKAEAQDTTAESKMNKANGNDLILQREHARQMRELEQTMALIPKPPQQTFVDGAIPCRRLRGVGWVEAGEDDWVLDVYYTVMRQPNDAKLWIPAVPCFMVTRKSRYLEGVLKQQQHLPRATVVFTMIEGKLEVQRTAIEKLFSLMLSPSLHLYEASKSKDFL